MKLIYINRLKCQNTSQVFNRQYLRRRKKHFLKIIYTPIAWQHKIIVNLLLCDKSKSKQGPVLGDERLQDLFTWYPAAISVTGSEKGIASKK